MRVKKSISHKTTQSFVYCNYTWCIFQLCLGGGGDWILGGRGGGGGGGWGIPGFPPRPSVSISSSVCTCSKALANNGTVIACC